MNRNNLIIICGIDGGGKSNLLKKLEQCGYYTSHWTKLENLDLTEKLNFNNPGNYIQTLVGKDRLNFIKGYVQSEWRYLIQPILQKRVNVIADSFFIKFYCKEQIYNKLSLENLLKTSPLTGNEFIIIIDTPPKIAFLRKQNQKISSYEYYKSQDDFIIFQKKLRINILNFTKGFERVIIDGTEDKNILSNSIRKILIEHNLYPNFGGKWKG